MKVAIIGAGPSGLSCAYELEKHGIEPVIFEEKAYVGDILEFTGIWSRLITHPFGDSIKYLYKRYGLAITPLSCLKEEILISQNKKITISGNLGFIMERGTEKNSLEKQIAAKIKTPIKFNNKVDLRDIKNDFTHIVVASASSDIPKQMGVWTDTLISNCRIATVSGDFKTDSVTAWYNTKYSKNLFVSLIPKSRHEATIMLLINQIPPSELDFYWKEYLSIENINYPVTDIRDAEHSCGFVQPLKKGNVYFVGNAGGLTDSVFGIGAFNAIESGITAARCIVNNWDYNKLMAPFYRDIAALHEFRKAINNFNNESFDRVLSVIGLPVIRQMIFNNPFLKMRFGAFIPKLYNLYRHI